MTGGEFGQRIEFHVLVEMRIDRHQSDMAHHQRVAIGRLRQHVGGADNAVGAGAIVHDHRLMQACLNLVGNQARHDVGSAAGSCRYDEADRMIGIIFSAGLLRQARQDGGHDKCSLQSHRMSPPMPFCFLGLYSSEWRRMRKERNREAERYKAALGGQLHKTL